jgi:hypothetical protein
VLGLVVRVSINLKDRFMLLFPSTTTANEYVGRWLVKMVYKFNYC